MHENVHFSSDPTIGFSRLDPYERFCISRHNVLAAFCEWAESGPSPSELAKELEGTIGALWGIAATVSACQDAKELRRIGGSDV